MPTPSLSSQTPFVVQGADTTNTGNNTTKRPRTPELRYLDNAHRRVRQRIESAAGVSPQTPRHETSKKSLNSSGDSPAQDIASSDNSDEDQSAESDSSVETSGSESEEEDSSSEDSRPEVETEEYVRQGPPGGPAAGSPLELTNFPESEKSLSAGSGSEEDSEDDEEDEEDDDDVYAILELPPKLPSNSVPDISHLRSRIDDFLPQLQAANAAVEAEKHKWKLNSDMGITIAKVDDEQSSEEEDIDEEESEDEDDDDEGEGRQYIEMNLGLGVLSERKKPTGSIERPVEDEDYESSNEKDDGDDDDDDDEDVTAGKQEGGVLSSLLGTRVKGTAPGKRIGIQEM